MNPNNKNIYALIPSLTERLSHNGSRIAITAALASLILFAFISYTLSERPYPGFPMVGRPESEKTNWPAKMRWLHGAKDLVFRTLYETQKPFQVIGSSGPLIILPAHYIEEIRTDERMTFKSWLQQDFFTNYAGFEGFRPAVDNNVFTDSVRVGLTQTLGHIISTIEDETKLSLKELFPLSDEWQEINFDKAGLRIIARISSRTFLPKPLCYNEDWLRIAVDYTVDFFKGAYILRAFPPFMRPFMNLVLPNSRALRNHVKTAQRIIQPTIDARKKQESDDIQAGRAPKKYSDAIEWIEATARKSGTPCDPVYGLLNYAIGAVHTTTITFVNIVYNIMSHPEYVDELRQELITVFNEEPGWTKARLNKLRLMDSCMKESNRTDPASLMTINRVADATIKLSDGTVIPKGAKLTVPNIRLTDPSLYANPDEFDGHRFLEMRQKPNNENKHQFVSTSNDYLPFGHGKHACPGRFFAGNEIKVVLAHLLLQYDFKFPEGEGRPPRNFHGLDRGTNPDAKILFKKRTPEVSLA